MPLSEQQALGLLRLEKLANHLLHGKLGHKVFDFTCVNDDRDNNPAHAECGYRGCAIGELPIAFPNDWKFHASSAIRALFKQPNYSGYWLDVQEFFDISLTAANRLFIPESGNFSLPAGSSKKEVANRGPSAKTYNAYKKARVWFELLTLIKTDFGANNFQRRVEMGPWILLVNNILNMAIHNHKLPYSKDVFKDWAIHANLAKSLTFPKITFNNPLKAKQK